MTSASMSCALLLLLTPARSFNVHGVRYIDDNQELGPVEEEIRDLAQALQVVKDEQSYLVVRERTHRDTCESTVSGARCGTWDGMLMA